jgi:hypothetical protein
VDAGKRADKAMLDHNTLNIVAFRLQQIKIIEIIKKGVLVYIAE